MQENMMDYTYPSFRAKPATSKTGFGQVKIMKEFVWMNRFFFLNLAFVQVPVGEK